MIEPSEEGIAEASELIRNGCLVAFPTETVYGLGANALDEKAVVSIFTAKGRPLTDPLIVHVATLEAGIELIDVGQEEEEVFRLLGNRFWPGPLTMIVKAAACIPLKVTAETGFVGIRCPSHPLALDLLATSGVPIAAPSANRFGHVSPTKAAHVLADLETKGVRVLNGDGTVYESRYSSSPSSSASVSATNIAAPSSSSSSSSSTCLHGIESTVCKIDLSRRMVVIFRQGAVTQVALQTELLAHAVSNTWSVEVVTRSVNMHAQLKEQEKGPEQAVRSTPIQVPVSVAGEQAPGQAITHYAPDVPCFLARSLQITTFTDLCETLEGSLNVTAEEAKASLVVLDFAGQLGQAKDSCLAYRDLSSSGDAAEAARRLFEALRWAECLSGAARVVLADIGTAVTQPLGPGLADRIMRATSARQVDLAISWK